MVTVRQGAQCLVEGGVIADPTEAVYGLGCDPDNESAVRSILRLKNRPESAGLILIADRLERFAAYIGAVSGEQKHCALETWPGPVTGRPSSGRARAGPLSWRMAASRPRLWKRWYSSNRP